MTTRTTALPHAALGASALFQGYADADADALQFYRWNPWSAADRAEAARVAAESARHRGAVADVLAEQNTAWGADDLTLTLVDRLRQPNAVAVVTGQQLGLFGGPLYTAYKALSAMRLAERLEQETGRPAVPVFWLADEDHDFAEIHRAAFSDGPDVWFVAYDDGLPADANRGAVGRLILDAEVLAETFRQLEAALPHGPHREDALRLARDAYVSGRSMRDAFAHLLRTLVPGIVLMSADDARLKRIAVPLFRREIEGWSRTYADLEVRSGELESAGFHAQIGPSPVNLFWIGDDGRRLPLDPVGHPSEPAGQELELRGTGARFFSSDLLARLESSPERFSPNVVLRPLLQDVLLPTAAIVAGPGEAAYFAQLGPVYERFGVPMPAVELRLSLTAVKVGITKILDRYDLGVEDLSGDLGPVWRRLALAQSVVDLEVPFDRARGKIEDIDGLLGGVVTDVDESLELALGAARAAMQAALRRLEKKTIRVEKRHHETIRQRLERAQAALWPGSLQERVISPLQLVAAQGTGVLRNLVASVPLDASVHHVIRL